MSSTISYLNTDLDLVSSADLTMLAEVLAHSGLFPLDVSQREDGLWHAAFETLKQYAEPEPNISAMLTVIEALADPHRSHWQGCARREFNIGYDCGREPWAFTQDLSSGLLDRIAAAGASLRITLYPERERG